MKSTIQLILHFIKMSYLNNLSAQYHHLNIVQTDYKDNIIS